MERCDVNGGAWVDENSLPVRARLLLHNNTKLEWVFQPSFASPLPVALRGIAESLLQYVWLQFSVTRYWLVRLMGENK